MARVSRSAVRGREEQKWRDAIGQEVETTRTSAQNTKLAYSHLAGHLLRALLPLAPVECQDPIRFPFHLRLVVPLDML